MSLPVASHPVSSATDVWETGLRWLEEDRAVALATVVATWGSSPVPIGGQMVIADEERFVGSVSGGCIETEVIVAALDIIEHGGLQVLSFGVAHETAWEAGLPCGGTVRVLVERLDAASGPTLLSAAITELNERTALLVKTNIDDGSRVVVRERDEPQPDDMELLRAGRSRLLELPDGSVFCHAIVPGPRILIIGATQISRALVAMCRLVGMDAIVIDPREAYASDHRFSGIARRVGWPKDVLAEIGLDGFCAVVALAHVADIDDQALHAALRSPCRYVGALGSVRNHAKRTERLTKAGFSEVEIARIRCPVGIDIGALQPAEIAVSVMAEIIRAFRGTKRAAG